MKYHFLAVLLLITVCSCHNPNKTKIEKLLEFVKVEGGTFTMGSNEFKDELIHQVELSSFYIQKTEVTQELWEEVMGSNPSEDKTWKQNPVTHVSWNDCQKFIKKLNKITGKKYRLPTEAEWEYAARGGNKSKGYLYAGSMLDPNIARETKEVIGAGEIPFYIDDVAWYNENSNGKIHPVAEKAPNELGLYDMSGNVWEWCQDWYGDYRVKIKKNPQGPDNGTTKVLRGGSWYFEAVDCRVARRYHLYPDFRIVSSGFRLALPVK